MDFSHSTKARDYLLRTQTFMQERVLPAETEYFQTVSTSADHHQWQQPALTESLKEQARSEGLWNMFLPCSEWGAGLSNAEYAPIAEATGWSLMAPEVFNCNAPDTGNAEVLWKYGSEAQKEQWLKPLLSGEIRSAFCMTEPDVASSDATNIEGTCIIEGNEIVLNGRKWWSSGIGHPNCKFLIFMGVSNPKAGRHQRHAMVLVPLNTPGVNIDRMLSVMGDYDAPFGHGEVSFNNVRLPLSAFIGGPGRGFEIAQGRLGPGRIHHCMRLIGTAEKALKLLCERGLSRKAFGQPLINLNGNPDIIANNRIAIEQARLLTLKAAWLMDTKGIKGAMSEVSQIKVVAPNIAQQVVDAAIQMHGGAGVSDDLPFTRMLAMARVLRLADGPDEVHRALIARMELKKYQQKD